MSRAVSNPQEMDALRHASLIQDEQGTVAFCLGGSPKRWTMGGYEYTTTELLDEWLTLPAHVLWEPADD